MSQRLAVHWDQSGTTSVLAPVLIQELPGPGSVHRPAGREDDGRVPVLLSHYRPLMPPLGGPLGAGPPLLGPSPGPPGPQPPRPLRPDGVYPPSSLWGGRPAESRASSVRPVSDPSLWGGGRLSPPSLQGGSSSRRSPVPGPSCHGRFLGGREAMSMPCIDEGRSRPPEDEPSCICWLSL